MSKFPEVPRKECSPSPQGTWSVFIKALSATLIIIFAARWRAKGNPVWGASVDSPIPMLLLGELDDEEEEEKEE